MVRKLGAGQFGEVNNSVALLVHGTISSVSVASHLEHAGYVVMYNLVGVMINLVFNWDVRLFSSQAC